MTRKEAADAARFELAQAEKQLQIFVLSELEKLSNRIFGEIETLTGQIDAARAGGESPLSFITRRNALRRIFDQVNLEVLRSAAALSSALTQTKRTAAKIAEQQIKESIELLTKNVFDFDSEATRQIIELSADNKPLAVHFARIAAPVRQAIFDALSYGIATGQPAQKIAREIKAAARNSGAVRAMTIARTETNRAYRETTLKNYERIESVRGWQWQAALDLRTCPICWAMHGRIFATKTPFGTHPNCLIENTKVAASDLQNATRRFYEGEVVNIQTLKGFDLTVTPNHPVLTLRGWVKAKFLNEADYVFSASDPQRVCGLINPNNANVPTVCQKIFNFNFVGGGVFSSSMPVSPEHFDGDFGDRQSDVNIKFVNSFLSDNGKIESFKKINKPQFVTRLINRLGFDAFGAFDQCFNSNFFAASGAVGGNSIFNVFGFCPFGHHQSVSFDLFANLYTVFGKNATDDISANIQRLSNGIFALKGGITTNDGFTVDKIKFLHNRFYKGNVYNFETSTNYYLANNIITHNCRCTMTPVFKGEKADYRQTGGYAFSQLNEAQQTAILGKRRFRLYQAGGIKLPDFVETKQTVFGLSRVLKPVSSFDPGTE